MSFIEELTKGDLEEYTEGSFEPEIKIELLQSIVFQINDILLIGGRLWVCDIEESANGCLIALTTV